MSTRLAITAVPINSAKVEPKDEKVEPDQTLPAKTRFDLSQSVFFCRQTHKKRRFGHAAPGKTQKTSENRTTKSLKRWKCNSKDQTLEQM